MSYRQFVVAFASISVLGWVLSAAGVGGKLPPIPYVIADVPFEVVLLVGLWFRRRWAWALLIGLTALGLLLNAARLVGGDAGRHDAVVFVLGLVQLALLAAPGIRGEFEPRPA